MTLLAIVKTGTNIRTNFGIRVSSSLLCGLACLISAGCGGAGKNQGPAVMPPPLVTVERATSRDVPLYLNEIGTNSAFESVTVMPQVDGRIVELHFRDGADLKKGDLLFVIDPRPFQNQLDSARANLAQQKAALDLARIQFDRAAAIINTRAISQQDYDTKKNAVSVQEAQVQAAQAAVENAKLNLEYCYIRSPIDGRAGARLVDVGDTVKANTAELLSIRRIDPIYANFTITERELPKVQAKLSHGGLKALVRVPSEPEAQARMAKVEFLDNSVQDATGTVGLRATVPNRDRQLWPGQFVNVKLILGVQQGAVLIPSQATQISQTGPFVYVVNSENAVELRQLSLGQRQGENVVVLQGVTAGEQVVTTGQLTLSPGAKVRIDTGGAATPSAAPGKPADE